VTGPDGAAGLDVISGEHLLVAADPDRLLSALQRILRDDDLWRQLSRNGRDLVRRRYVPEVAFGALDAVLARRP
jgi:glycosyltransferase involved in cell wall biosynthesis